MTKITYCLGVTASKQSVNTKCWENMWASVVLQAKTALQNRKHFGWGCAQNSRSSSREASGKDLSERREQLEQRARGLQVNGLFREPRQQCRGQRPGGDFPDAETGKLGGGQIEKDPLVRRPDFILEAERVLRRRTRFRPAEHGSGRCSRWTLNRKPEAGKPVQPLLL